ncbi:hypothetical protein QO011_001944 [Labrys wisconsinensis]|uniref:Uncharacterized protein n=1 Tax=Labrys wisconsinensis TaxID=425677 RepID=A0ABU0J6N4_9HYPH|nr:hypothetical protein [Labrys wisconsinensis]
MTGAEVGYRDEVSYRFVPTAAGLDALFARYEQERRLGGIGATLQRVSPQQRIDAVVAMFGLNASKGWRRIGEEPAADLWLRYLTPVLAETRESAAALAVAARAGLPGAFDPPIAGVASSSAPPPPSLRPPPSRRNAGMLIATVVAVGVAALGLYVGWEGPAPPPCSGCPAPPEPVPSPAPLPLVAPDATNDAAAAPDTRAYRAAMTITVGAVVQHGNDITPRALAAIYAGESDSAAAPAAFLAAMLRQWSLRADAPIPRDAGGVRALTHYAAVDAAIESGTMPSTIGTADQESALDDTQRQILARFANGAPVGPPRPAAVVTWPPWLPWLAFLPAALTLAWAVASLPRALSASLVNPEVGARGQPVSLPVEGLLVTTPPPQRKLARQISWREPGSSRRMNVERSIRATLARGGFLTAVPLRRPRSAEYVFLVSRLRRDDVERDRVSRFIDALSRGGLALTVYDYDPDPSRLIPRRPGDDDAATPQAGIGLRGLRERHAEARLVLVTDGAELVDFFTQRPRRSLTDELAAWPARMLLTPTPMAEWGERELNLAQALGALVGRATPDGFRDLALAFGERPSRPPRLPPAAADDEAGFPTRLVAWLEAMDRLIGPDDVAPRPDPVRFDDPMLRSDAPLPPADTQALVEALRGWLGPRGFLWLAACAAYPQLRFDITLYLGLKIAVPLGPMRMPLYDEALLARLTLLPWFRLGRMPPWLRRALFDALPVTAREWARAAVDTMLNGEPPFSRQATPAAAARLPIWRPEARGLDVPPDAVMAELTGRAADDLAPSLRNVAFRTVFRERFLDLAASRCRVVLPVLLWCAVAWWIWPASDTSTPATGAWLPLLCYGAATVAAAVALMLIGRRSRRAGAPA